MKEKYYCPVCGYDGFENPPYDNGGASHDICSCCGFQFGLHDYDRGIFIEEWRQKWIDEGMRFDEGDSKPPTNWNPEKQLENARLSDLTGYDYELVQEAKNDPVNQ